MKERRKLPISSQVIPELIAFLDSAVVLGSAALCHLVVVGSYGTTLGHYAAAVAFVWLTSLLLMHFAGLYQFEAIMRPLEFVDKIVIAFVTTFLFLLAAAFSLKVSSDYSRIWFASFAISACTVTLVMRLIASSIVARLADKRLFTRNVVIAGSGAQLTSLLSHMQHSQPRFLSVVGLFVDDTADERTARGSYPILGSLDDLPAFARRNVVDDVILSLPWSADGRLLALINRLRELAINVYLASDIIGYRVGFRQAPSHFGNLPIFEVVGKPLSGWKKILKVCEDYLLATLATVLLVPVMAVIALAIKLDSKGPVLFRQSRLGYINQEFEIYKFRTMQFEPAPEMKTIQATRGDPRVTRVGRFLRRWSLDELPQLLNVLNGTMSLVGPRPHAVDHNQDFSEKIRNYFVRHRVKPGMTGWAQVNGFRGQTNTVEKMEARVKFDIIYAENWSLWFDVKILLMTIVICLTGRNAY